MVYKIAIDGPAGSGKSTVTQLLRKKMGYKTINSGNIYRAITYILNKKFGEVDLTGEIVINFINNLKIKMVKDDLYYDGVNISPFLRTKKIDDLVSEVAKPLYIRKKAGLLQLEFIEDSESGLIIEGRDIGTNVLPDATLKIYLDADAKVRAKRRFNERPEVSYQKTLDDILARDLSDKTREHGRLIIADDAVVICTDNMTVEEVVENIYKIFNEKIK
ncbi:cytidylate kinase (cmk) [Vairimorpha necatrix]|uniref:(d)CMP kinase n=1 Tax=Vairimorpha necatrix TaxID=6039 RepID=A0AAX4J8Z2_9MICR